MFGVTLAGRFKHGMASNPKRLNLALQGGGAYGAFTWGVLDRLLEDERIAIGAVSGTSAGAVNAVALASGLAKGRDETRQLLEDLWSRVSRSTSHGGPLDYTLRPWTDAAFGMMSKLISPYQFNPLNVNPLRDVLADIVDFSAIAERNCGKTDARRIYIAATDVQTGQCRIFPAEEISLDAVLASCCLPQLFHAVEIDGRHYWDGGFTANPPLAPLMTRGPCSDTLIVQLAGPKNEKIPYSATDIGARTQRIMFSQPLQRELAWIAEARLNREVGPYAGKGGRRLRRHRLHMISADLETNGVEGSGPIGADWSKLRRLRDQGQVAADQWITEHFADIGRRETLELTPPRRD